MTTEQKRLKAWRRWLAVAGDVLRMMFSWRAVGRRRARGSRQTNTEPLEQQEQTLRELRLEAERRQTALQALRQADLYTVLRRLDVEPILNMRGADALRWILSRIQDEAEQNLVQDHWHPEIAKPLRALVMALRQALERAGESMAWVPATRGRR